MKTVNPFGAAFFKTREVPKKEVTSTKRSKKDTLKEAYFYGDTKVNKVCKEKSTKDIYNMTLSELVVHLESIIRLTKLKSIRNRQYDISEYMKTLEEEVVRYKEMKRRNGG